MRKKQLLKLAEEKGAKIVIEQGRFIIKNKGISVSFWEDGSNLRTDVRGDFALKMTVTESAKALKLI